VYVRVCTCICVCIKMYTYLHLNYCLLFTIHTCTYIPQAKFHEDPSSRALCFTYILTLGFQRLTYATGDRQFWPWVFLVLTHVVEAWMWWTIGIQAGYLDGYESVTDFVVAVATANHAEKFSKILLIVPVLILVFLVTGPESSSTKQKKK
jgi:hypothetical protein